MSWMSNLFSACCFADSVSSAQLCHSNYSQFPFVFLKGSTSKHLPVICHCIMGCELFWVNTHPILLVIPSCLPDELWERTHKRQPLRKQSSFCGVVTVATLLPPFLFLWVINDHFCLCKLLGVSTKQRWITKSDAKMSTTTHWLPFFKQFTQKTK